MAIKLEAFCFVTKKTHIKDLLALIFLEANEIWKGTRGAAALLKPMAVVNLKSLAS